MDQNTSSTKVADVEPTRPTGKESFIVMSGVKARPPEWLWEQRIPLGELTLIDGDPATNKSSLTLDIAARVSIGGEMPDKTKGVKGGVLLLTAEDSITKTLPYRLEAAGANMERIVVFKEPMSIPKDLQILEDTACRFNARLLVIDPLMFFLEGNANGDQSVRKALTPLKRLAERANMAVLLVRHLNKSGGKLALYRGGGSIAITGIARSGFLIGNHPEDRNLRVMCHYKSNLGLLTKSMLFEPVSADNALAIEWRGECDLTADDLLARGNKRGQMLERAKNFLHERLQDGPVSQKEIKEAATNNGIAYKTLERAKDAIGVESHRKGFGPNSFTYWCLPKKDEA